MKEFEPLAKFELLDTSNGETFQNERIMVE